MDTPVSPSQAPGPALSSASAPAERTSTLVLEGVAVLLLLLDMLASYVLMLAKEGNSPEATGAALAPPLLLLLVLVAFRAFGKARTRRSKATIACWTLGFIWIGNSANLGRQQEDRVLTVAERTGLTIDGEFIRHRAFGFSFPYPGRGFHFDAEAQAIAAKQMSHEPSMAAWVLTDTVRSGVVFVEVVKNFKTTQTSFTQFATGFRKPFEAGARALLMDSVRWSDLAHDYRLAAVSKEGLYVKARCLPSKTSGQTGLIVCVETIARDSTSLGFVRDGLQLVGRE